MPTGYTAYIEDGDINNGRDFILLCTRAFGIAMDIREEPLTVPIPTVFEPDVKYHTDCLNKAIAEKARLTVMTNEEWHLECVKDREKRIAEAKKHYENDLELDKKYLKVKHEVEAWNPPKNCKEIKKFALEQIKISRPDLSHDHKWLALAEREIDEDERFDVHMKSCERDITYHQERIAEEIKRAKEKTQFMKDLCDSLKESFGEAETDIS